MMTKPLILGVSLAFLSGFFVVSIPVSQAEAGCKSNVVSRLVKARFKSLGKQRARANWSKKARQKYGWSYRKWSKAKGNDYHITVDGTKFRLYHIRAFGQPCN